MRDQETSSGGTTTYWCVNFDGNAGPMGNEDREYVLRHGLNKDHWAMQYQFYHGGHDFQQNTPGGAIAANWNLIGQIRPGDWCAAYLRSSTFYAVGKVVRPRKLAAGVGQPIHRDTIVAALQRRPPLHLAGVVEYTDAEGAFYEDFTDEWGLTVHNPACSTCQASRGPLEIWRYPQRVDVAEWELIRSGGVTVAGISEVTREVGSIPFRAAFRVTPEFFKRIREALA